MKRKTFIAALLVACLAITAAGSIAFFNAEETAYNVITTGTIDITINEWADLERTTSWDNDDHGTGVMPGQTVVKLAEVTNSGNSDAYVRVAVEKQLELDPDYEALLKGEAPDMSLIVIDIDENWEDGGDGFYYYKTPLAPGETTTPVFQEVTFAASMGNAYQNAVANVTIHAAAVQVRNNGTSAKDAAGWPAPMKPAE
ncbi:MAG: hypothetical protein HUJ80_01025 [Firmicutes bacterium]|nr:hypothetical protein [Bacillota bacterium]